MRKKIVIGNWKMNLNLNSAKELTSRIIELHKTNTVDVGICPPSIYIQAISSLTKGTKILFGAQNMFYENEGAFTGEISPQMLKDFPVDMILIGHSERREVFKETDEYVNKKIKAALSLDLLPVVCVGESLKIREEGKAEEWVKSQVIKALDGLENSQVEKLIVAYEPIWAIGTGKVCEAEDANKIISMIRETIKAKTNDSASKKVRILYGGSIKSSNFFDIVKYENIDGGLVGGASLKADEFLKIVEAAEKAQSVTLK